MNTDFLLFRLPELIWSQNKDIPNEYNCPDPVLLNASRYPSFQTGVDYVGPVMRIITFGNTHNIDIGSRKLISVRHDMVASGLTSKTDELLSSLNNCSNIMPNEMDHLTPDYIHLRTQSVLELATTANDELSYMDNVFDGKRKKYEYILKEKGNITFYILVVGPNHVFTNLNLSMEAVNELCLRMRMGLEIENKIIENLGQDIFKDNEVRADELRIEKILESIQYDESHYLKNFGDDIEDLVDAYMTPEDKQTAYEVLADCTSKAFKTDNPMDISKITDYEEKMRDPLKTTIKNKRVANFPLVFCNPKQGNYKTPVSPLHAYDGNDVPADLRIMWAKALSQFKWESYDKTIDSIRGEALDVALDKPKHSFKQKATIRVELSKKEELLLATRGVQAKKNKNNPIVLEHEANSKLSFSIDAPTKDIEEFLEFSGLEDESINDSCLDKSVHDLLKSAKIYSGMNMEDQTIPQSLNMLESLLSKNRMLIYCDMISTSISEVAFSYRQYVNDNCYLLRFVPKYNMFVMIKATGTHTFVSYCFNKKNSSKIDPGRIGPALYDAGEYIISDFCSYDEAMLEHLVKAGPYITSISIHLMHHYNIDIKTLKDRLDFFESNDRYWRTMNLILLLYLNNKSDAEELITSQRYLFMKILEDQSPKITVFCDRLPSILRSRLTSYLVKETIKLIRYYMVTPVIKKETKDMYGSVNIEYLNIKSFFSGDDVSLEQKINEFYFGYVISKVKGKGASGNYKILEKILKEEYYFRDEVAAVFSNEIKVQPHVTNKAFLKFILNVFTEICKRRFGETYKSIFKRDILRDFAYSNFSTLATLKASAKSHTRHINVPANIPIVTREIEKVLRKSNPFEGVKRPKVIEAITKLVKEFQKSEKRLPTHLFDMVPYCLKRLEEKGGIDSDIFPKDQHGGKREIHVLEIAARILQFYVELMARNICNKFQSETITHPEYKTKFVDEHYKNASVTFENYITVCKSADISKWCQRHHVSKFCAVLMNLTDELFHGLIFRTFRLWVLKRISFPLQLVAVLLANENTPDSDPIFSRLKKEFYTGTGVIESRFSNTMHIESGMMQGIWHLNSTLLQMITQEAMKDITIKLSLKKFNLPMVMTIVEGSDDSAALISVPINNSKSFKICRSLLMLKEHASEYLSMFYNKAKTACGILDLVEYNSEWFLRRKSVKPTFRWISAALETSIVERFADRMRIFNNTLSQCLEGGATTFELSVVQMCQAILHYKLLGSDNHVLFKDYAKLLQDNPFPSYGFYTLDCDILAGIPGFDYQLYCLAKNSLFGQKLSAFDGSLTNSILDYDGSKETNLPTSLKAVKIGFGKLTLWQSLLKRIDLGDLKEALEAIEKDPMLVYGKHNSWEQDKYTILLKLFSPGVKSSLSNFQPVIRMMIAAAYMLNRPCMTELQDMVDIEDVIDDDLPTLDSLGLSVQIVKDCNLKTRLKRDYDQKKIRLSVTEKVDLGFAESMRKGEVQSKKNPKVSLYLALKNVSELNEPTTISLDEMFPLHMEYENLYTTIDKLQRNIGLQDINMKRGTKVDVLVFTDYKTDDFPLIDMVKYKWFSIRNVPLSRSQFSIFWQAYKAKYKFLRDTEEETQKVTGYSVLELKNFIESVSSKSRKLHLSDTQAKSNNLTSLITRIWWPNIKLRSGDMTSSVNDFTTLRSNIFAISTFPFTRIKKENLIRNLIQRSPLLAQDTSMIPNNCKRLKVMHEMLNGVHKTFLIHKIAKEKLGSVGFFSIRQRRDPFSDDYKGKGEWRGAVCGIDCIIKLHDNFCESITLSRITDITLLGQGLLRMVKEFKRLFPNMLQSSKDKIYLNQRGKIITTTGSNRSDCIPISIDPNLSIGVLEKMLALDWRITIQDQTVRMVLADNASLTGRAQEYTILNDTLRFSDWDHTSQCLIQKEPLLQSWMNGTPMRIKDLRNEILKYIPNNQSNFDKWIVQYRNVLKGFVNGYDLQLLLRLLIDFTTRSDDIDKTVQDQIKELTKISLDPLDMSMVEVNNMIKKLERMDIDSIINKESSKSKLIQDFLKDDEDAQVSNKLREWSSDGSPDFEITEDRLDRLCQELYNSGANVEELEELELLVNKGMSKTNKFFNSLDRLISDTLEITTSDFHIALLRGEYYDKYPDIIGKLASIISGKFLLETEAEEYELDLAIDAFELEQDTIKSIGSTSVSSMSREQNISELQSTVEHLQSMIPSAQGPILDVLLRLQHRTLRKIDLLRNDDDIQPLEDADYDKIILELINLSIANDWLKDLKELVIDESYLIPLFKMELNGHIANMLRSEEITIDESSSYRLAIRKSVISGWLLDCLSSFLNVKIIVSNHTELVYKSQQPVFSQGVVNIDTSNNSIKFEASF